ncbi:hypothetical protein VTL71DRAFT_16168 [Oculimacula yallundae]|uniref:Uncharacterized protein n=1 Tax=Oculimacula yallundae TaxID=86028 RepID=A0ABR4CDQ6_9HELO
MKPLYLLIALLIVWKTAFGFELRNAAPASPQSSEVDTVTTKTIVSDVVVSHDSTAVVFFSTNAAGGVTDYTTKTREPGPPETFASTVITTQTLRKTSTVFSSGSTFTSGSSPSLTTSPTPGVSASSTPRSDPSSPQRGGLSKAEIIAIVLVVVFLLSVACYAAYLLEKRGSRDRADQRGFAYRTRIYFSNMHPPAASHDLSSTNLNTYNDMVTMDRSNPSNMAPVRPPRPASLSLSLQETMGATPVQRMRRSPRNVDIAPALDSEARALIPKPLNIVKQGSTSRNRSNTKSSTTPRFGDHLTRDSTGIDTSQLDTLRALEDELGGIELEQRIGEKKGRIAPLLLKSSDPSAEDSEHDHQSTPPTQPEELIASPVRQQHQFADPNEEDEEVRDARRAATERALNGEAPYLPPTFDFAKLRAERELIAHKQRLIAEKQKKMAESSENITGFSAGPIPKHPPPPPPGPPPSSFV